MLLQLHVVKSRCSAMSQITGTNQGLLNTQKPISLSDDTVRFQVELEFVQCLANPNYLNFLAQRGYFKVRSMEWGGVIKPHVYNLVYFATSKHKITCHSQKTETKQKKKKEQLAQMISVMMSFTVGSNREAANKPCRSSSQAVHEGKLALPKILMFCKC